MGAAHAFRKGSNFYQMNLISCARWMESSLEGCSLQARASHKSFRAKDGSDSDGGDGANFHGQKRSNETHEWTSDPDARLYKKSYGQASPVEQCA